MDTPNLTPKKRPELVASEVIAALPAACVSEEAARAFIELHRWKGEPCCPHCGELNVYRMTGEKAVSRGLWRCHGCKKQFTVRVGSVFEDSKIPLRDWCKAIWACIRSKNGCSALELKRELQCSYRTALFVLHRLRHAMAAPHDEPPLSGTVEVDEVFIGGRQRHMIPRPGRNPARGPSNKIPVVAMLERGGRVRTRIVPDVTGATLRSVLAETISPDAELMTDEWRGYYTIGKTFKRHGKTSHGRGIYVDRNDRTIHSNTVESFFARVRRGLDGTYIAVSREHLHRYMSEFEFRHDTSKMTDGQRASELIARTGGKRLLYKEPEGQETNESEAA